MTDAMKDLKQFKILELHYSTAREKEIYEIENIENCEFETSYLILYMKNHDVVCINLKNVDKFRLIKGEV